MAPGSADIGALITPEGNLVIATPNQKEWERLASIKSLVESIASIPKEEVPEDLKCTDCGNLLNDAVKVPCCDSAFCDECMRKVIDEATVGSACCPFCKKVLQPEQIAPNPALRRRVKDFVDSCSSFNLPPEMEPAKFEESSGSGKNAVVTPLPPPAPGMPPFPFHFMLPGMPPMMPPPFPFMMPPPPPPPSYRPDFNAYTAGSSRRNEERTRSRSRSPDSGN